MGIMMKFIRAIKAKHRTVKDEQEKVDIIKQIESEAEKLEKQWEEKEKEFALVSVHRVRSIPPNFPEPPPGVWRVPNKHLKKLWKDFVKVKKKLHALEHYVRLLGKKELSAMSKHDQRVLRRLRRIIRLGEEDTVAQMKQELLDFQQVIEEGRKLEDKYMQRWYLSENGGRRYEKDDKLLKGLRKECAGLMKERFGYDYDMRAKFLDHLEEESKTLIERLKKLDQQ